jgi:transcription elongation factor Elf1
LWSDEQARKKKAASKTRFTCPECGANAWGKAGLNLVCGDCDACMEVEEDEDGDS